MPAEPVAVLLLHRAGDQNGVLVGQQAQILHDLGAVNRRDHAAPLVGSAAPADFGFGFIALIGVEGPVGQLAQAHGVDMSVVGDQGFAGAHPAEGVSHGVQLGLVIAQLLHFGQNPAGYALLLAALAGNADEVPQESGHVRPVALSGLFDCVKVHAHILQLYLI
ncbi:hypothetical protein SDC9_205893 [bioreactor metagenome]|uniref:Uncharacterized protein n=1 Tax=bioreactor metagenome TaxID=1076179 RepID=A0A645J4Y3_9ZZZZ